jgi:sugar-specific transcriptional regulator TrmB
VTECISCKHYYQLFAHYRTPTNLKKIKPIDGEIKITSQWDEGVELLKCLGLSPLQAKVYLTLDKLGSSTARQTYKFAGVARQDIYRILMELQQFGLVEKILALPTRFASLPLVDGVYLLLETKTKEDANLKTRVEDLIEKNKFMNKPPTSPDAAEFSVFNEKALIPKIEKALSETISTLDIILSKEKFSFWVFREEGLINKLLENGVRLRFIIDKFSNEIGAANTMIKDRHSHLSGKYALTASTVQHLALFDNKLLFCNSLEKSVGQTSVFCSNNSCLVVLAQNYFNEIWKKGIPISQKMAKRI